MGRTAISKDGTSTSIKTVNDETTSVSQTCEKAVQWSMVRLDALPVRERDPCVVIVVILRLLYVPRDAFRLLFPLPVPSACLRAAAPSLAPSQGDELLFTSNTPTSDFASQFLSNPLCLIGFGSLLIVQRYRPYYISYFLSPSVSLFLRPERRRPDPIFDRLATGGH